MSSLLSSNAKLDIFRTFVLCHFQYCSVVWHNCSKTDVKKLERLQKRGLRYVFNDFEASYEELLDRANMCTLETLRWRAMVVTVYRILHGLAPTYLSDLISVKHTHGGLRQHGDAIVLNIPLVKSTKHGLKSVMFLGAKAWNSLPQQIRKATSLNMFKSMVNTWLPHESLRI